MRYAMGTKKSFANIFASGTQTSIDQQGNSCQLTYSGTATAAAAGFEPMPDPAFVTWIRIETDSHRIFISPLVGNSSSSGPWFLSGCGLPQTGLTPNLWGGSIPGLTGLASFGNPVDNMPMQSQLAALQFSVNSDWEIAGGTYSDSTTTGFVATYHWQPTARTGP